MTERSTNPGWYNDPKGVHKHQAYWDGSKWTGATRPTPVGDGSIRTGSSEEKGVILRFLEAAGRANVIDLDTRLDLVAFLERGENAIVDEKASAPKEIAPKTEPTVPRSTRSPVPQASPSRPPAERVGTPAAPSAQVAPDKLVRAREAPTTPPESGRLSAFVTGTWDAVASEVALHGFAYLGVILTFIGVLGFLLFAFADVPDPAQPFVELFIAFIFFGWAWMLRRQRAERVADAMELVGGMVLPLILFAGFVDGAPFPPNYSGTTLIIALTVSSVALSGLYSWFSARHPRSTLRFLVAPLLWLGAMALGFVFKVDEELFGVAITRVVSPQPALASVAIALSLVAALYWKDHWLAAPTFRSSLVGVPVAYLLMISLSVSEGWVLVWPPVVLGVATFVSAELLALWHGKQEWMGVARPLLLAGVLGPLVPAVEVAWVGVIAVVAYLVLDLWGRPRHAAFTSGAFLAMAGVAIGLAMSLQDPLPALISFVLASVWAHVRRLEDQGEQATQAFAVAAALLPIGVVVGLIGLVGAASAWLVMAAVVAVLTVVIPRLDLEDSLWTAWLLGASLVVAVAATQNWLETDVEGMRVAATLGFVAVGVAIGRQMRSARVWLAAAAGSVGVAIGLETLGVAEETQFVIWAGAGLALALVAAIWRKAPAEHLGAIGHVTGAVTVVSLVGGGPEVFVLAAWALGWVVSAVADRMGGATVTELLTRTAARTEVGFLEKAAAWVVPIMLVGSVPFAFLAAANSWPEFRDHRSWTGILVVSIGLIYSLTSRIGGLGSPLCRSLAFGAVATSLIGVSVAAPDSWPTIYASAALIAIAAILSRGLRIVWFFWLAWAMTVVIALMLARQLGVASDSLHLVSLAWGGVLLLGGLVVDDVQSGRRRLGEGLRTPWLRYPVLLGALVVPLSLGPTFTQNLSVYGWWAAGASVAYFVVAFLIRVGSVTGAAYALGAVAATALSPWSLVDDPWRFIFIAVPLVALSWFAEFVQAESDSPWMRWDLPPLIVAHGVAVVALTYAIADGGLAPAALVFGLLSIAIGIWRKGRAWEEVGNLLIIVAAWDLGTGWLALALALTAVRGIIGVGLARERSRLSYHLIAVLGAGLAWPVFLDWLESTPHESASYSTLVFGGLGLLVGAANRWLRLRLDTTAWWGGLAVVGVLLAIGYAILPDSPGIDGPWFAAGLLALAVGLEMAARGVSERLLGVASVVTAGLAWLLLLFGLGWTLTDAVNYTALLFGGLAVVSSVLGRYRLISASNAIRWGVLGVVVVAAAFLGSFDPNDGLLNEGPALAIGLAVTALALDISWRFTATGARYAAVFTSGLAWIALVVGLGWESSTAAVWTGVVFGLLALGVGEAVRFREGVSQLDSARAWTLLGMAGVVAAVWFASRSDAVGDLGYWVAGSLAVLAVAFARGARPFQIDVLRDLSAVACLASLLTAAYTAAWSDELIAAFVLVGAAAATFFSLAAWRRRPDSVWLRPLVVLAAAANLFVAGLAVLELPDIALLIGVLLSVGIQMIAVGVIVARPGVLSVAPPLLGAAFILFIAESVSGSAQWYTVPIGLVLLAEVEIFRKLPRFLEPGSDRQTIVVLEWIAFGILAAPPLVEMFTVSLFVGLVGIGVAIGIFLWGVASKVRRRVIAAVALVIVTTVLMIFAAAAGSAPQSAFFWIVAVGIGFSVMLVAGFIEAYRSRKGKTMARLDELMEGWE